MVTGRQEPSHAAEISGCLEEGSPQRAPREHKDSCGRVGQDHRNSNASSCLLGALGDEIFFTRTNGIGVAVFIAELSLAREILQVLCVW
jgi:hypothetical protein